MISIIANYDIGIIGYSYKHQNGSIQGHVFVFSNSIEIWEGVILGSPSCL